MYSILLKNFLRIVSSCASWSHRPSNNNNTTNVTMCYKSCSAWPAYGSIICPVLVIDNYWLPCSKTPVGQKVRRPGRIQQSPILYIPPPPNKVCILRYWERSCRCEVAPCYLNSKFTFHGVSTSCNGVVIAPHALILSDSRMVVTISYIKRNNWDLWSSLNQLGLDRNWRPKSTGKIGDRKSVV